MPDAFIPFDLGPQACLGRFLAMKVMKLALAMFFQRYRARIDPTHPIEEMSLATNQPKYGVKVFIYK